MFILTGSALQDPPKIQQGEIPTQCWLSVGPVSQKVAEHLTNIGPMSRILWVNVAYHITWEYDWEELSPSKHSTLNQFWFNVGPASQTMVHY